MKIYMVCPIT